MCDLGVSEKDAKKYAPQSHNKVEIVCPNCRRTKEMRLDKIYNRKSIGCICKDGVSYPEKFLAKLLEQLNIIYTKEYSPKWSNKRKYDFYFELNNKKYIIETHGKQHYGSSEFIVSLENQQKIDKYKRELAISNGIDYYIELDCRQSSLEWIKNSILNSELNKIFDLSKIDWLECEKFALSNRVKEVCDYWRVHNEINNEILTTGDLANIFKLRMITIRRYLIKGTQLRWCNYNVEEERVKGVIRSKNINKQKYSKKVEIFKYNKSLGVFKSCHELDEQSEKLFGTKLNYSNISRVCRGVKKSYKGFEFKYV